MTSNQVERLDRQFGLYLRGKYDACRVCGRTDTLQVSHHFGRASLATRWDEDNAELVCDAHHRAYERMTREERKQYLVKKLGYERYMALSERAVSVKKWTPKEVNEMILKFSKTMV